MLKIHLYRKFIFSIGRARDFLFVEKSLLGFFIILALSIAIGLYVGLIIPHILLAHDLHRIDVTIRNIRTVATAVEAYAADNDQYPAVHSIEELAEILAQSCTSQLPWKDGFGNPLRYQALRDNPESPGPDNYALASAGKDSIWERSDLEDYRKEHTRSFEMDIVFHDWDFQQCPIWRAY